jgi:hypothetical protein
MSQNNEIFSLFHLLTLQSVGFTSGWQVFSQAHSVMEPRESLKESGFKYIAISCYRMDVKAKPA